MVMRNKAKRKKLVNSHCLYAQTNLVKRKRRRRLTGRRRGTGGAALKEHLIPVRDLLTSHCPASLLLPSLGLDCNVTSWKMEAYPVVKYLQGGFSPDYQGFLAAV